MMHDPVVALICGLPDLFFFHFRFVFTPVLQYWMQNEQRRPENKANMEAHYHYTHGDDL